MDVALEQFFILMIKHQTPNEQRGLKIRIHLLQTT